MRAADSETAHRAALHASKLHDECAVGPPSSSASAFSLAVPRHRHRRHACVRYAITAEAFVAWHARCLALLSLAAGPAAVKKEDLSKALDMVQSQSAEGEAHTRRADDLVREMVSYGVDGTNPCAVSLAEMRAKKAHLKVRWVT